MDQDYLIEPLQPDVWNTSEEEAVRITGLHYPKVPVVRRPEYVIAFEQFGDWTFVHVKVDKWGKQIRERFLKDCNAAFELHGGPVLSLCKCFDTKQRRFLVTAGFEHAGHVTLRDGTPREVMIKKR